MGLKTGVQYGTSVTANFSENTWTFEMPEDFKMTAGEFAILPKELFSALMCESIQEQRIFETKNGAIDLKKIVSVGSVKDTDKGCDFTVFVHKQKESIDFYSSIKKDPELIKIRTQLVEAWKKYKNQ